MPLWDFKAYLAGTPQLVDHYGVRLANEKGDSAKLEPSSVNLIQIASTISPFLMKLAFLIL